MQRTPLLTLLFAIAAALATVVAAALAYQGVRLAFEREFESRLAHVAGIAASQLAPEDLADVLRLGGDSGGFFAIQAQLDPLRALVGFEDLVVVGTNGKTLYGVRGGELSLQSPSPYDSLAHAAMQRALGGAPATARFSRDGAERRAAFAPVRPGGHVIAVLVAEASPAWTPVLERLGRRLALIALVSVAAIALLAGILMRATSRGLALERQLSRSENLAAMGRLTATLAHEIKNPLAIIRGSARRLGKLEPDAQRLANSVVEEVDRLSLTVSRYLQFARVEHGGDTQGDLRGAVHATLGLLEGEFGMRHCHLERDLPAEALPVRLDPESLKQVALNLVLNALEAAPEGGRVRVGVAAHAGHAEFRVSDDGPGIPADVLQRLGEPFFTTKAQGTGLGLFLSRRLVEGAGGQLRVESAPGAGTTVVVKLPLAAG